MTIHLEVKPRAGKAATVRRAGDIPAVVYGPKQPPLSIAVEKQVFEKVFRETGESTILTLTGLSEPIEVLVQDVNFDPTRGGAEHIDFYAIERGKELTTEVPLEFIGESPVLKQGGTVTKVLYEIEVTCRPSALPPHIEVDVSSLQKIDDQIRVSDLSLPAGVKAETDGDEVVAVASGAQEEPEETSEAPDMSTIEVEAKGKQETAEDQE